MAAKNKFGLNRSIPRKIKAEIRRKSKNGCVICRRGIYEYEHIDPEFWEAREHNPDQMCLLCSQCHAKVTRGLLSKKTVIAKYKEVEATDPGDVHEFFDFVGSEPRLSIGGLTVASSPLNILEIDGDKIFALTPKNAEVPAGMTATFNDDEGKKLFSIEENRWTGPGEYYDLDTHGKLLEIRMPDGRVSLRLEYEEPNVIHVRKLDMRHGSWHFLASVSDIAIGRYLPSNYNLAWMHVMARVDSVLRPAALIRCNTSKLDREIRYRKEEVFENLRLFMDQNQEGAVSLTTDVFRGISPRFRGGFSWYDLGISVGEGTALSYAGLCIGICSIDHARMNFFRSNRMNGPAILLPGVLTKDVIERALTEFKEQASARNQDHLKSRPEPFLVKPDIAALDSWHNRKDQSPSFNAAHDPMPGLRHASGLMKLVDDYDGPLMTIQRQPAADQS